MVKIIPTDIATSILDEFGAEINNPTPLTIHTGLNKPLSLDERVDRMLAIKLSQQNKQKGGESLEESLDFDIPDEDPPPHASCEFTEMQEEFLNTPAQPEPPQETPVKTPEATSELTSDALENQIPLPVNEPEKLA